MEPADQPPVARAADAKSAARAANVEFLPDADEIERRPFPLAARVTLYVVLAMLLAFLLWAVLFDVDRVVMARGRLVTPLPNIVVQPLETSIIKSLDVRIGQVVKKGDRLATLDPTFAEADQGQLRSRLRSLDTQSQRLEAELDGGKSASRNRPDSDSRLQAQLSAERQANYTAQMSKIDETMARLRATIDTNQRDQQVLGARVKSLREIESMQEKLVAEKFGARINLLEAQEKRLEVEREMQLAKNRQQELERELAAQQADKAAFTKGWRQKTMEDLLSTSRDRDTVNEQLQKADKRLNMVVLTSPVDAVVLDMAKVSQGSVVREAEPMFTLVPIAAELEAEVQIDSIDVGYVKLGDVARLKLDAYPFQRHGTIAARVRTVSEDAFRRDANIPGGGASGGVDAYYLSRIGLGDAHLKKMPEQARLLPGMTLTAEIVVGKRSVISYLLWPLTKALDESIREP